MSRRRSSMRSSDATAYSRRWPPCRLTTRSRAPNDGPFWEVQGRRDSISIGYGAIMTDQSPPPSVPTEPQQEPAGKPVFAPYDANTGLPAGKPVFASYGANTGLGALH